MRGLRAVSLSDILENTSHHFQEPYNSQDPQHSQDFGSHVRKNLRDEN